MTPDNEERQVATRLGDIRRDHVARYEWAAERVRGLSVLDLGCGVGYGSMLLSHAAEEVRAVDNDSAALAYALEHWRHASRDNLRYEGHDMSRGDYMVGGDVAVAFEMIEHLKDPRPMLRNLRTDTLLASVPNEDVFPWANYKYHHRHYTKTEFESLLNECGWVVTEWWGQEGTQSEVERDVNGRTLIAVCERGEVPRAEVGKVESVHLAGLGPSKYELTELMIQHDYTPPWDELWTVNKGIALFPHADKAFVMDDVYDYGTKHPAYGAELRAFKGEIIGQSTIANDGSIPYTEYPLADVLQFWGGSCANWLHTISIGYILAYAGMIGVKRLYLTGIDCSWPNRPDLTEAGNAVVCYWVGRLEGAGVEVLIAGSSALNHTNQRDQYGWRRFYGYLKQPQI